MTVRARHSILSPEALAGVVDAQYDLGGAPSCVVWHRGFNDYYLVKTTAGRFVLRVYPIGKYWLSGEPDIRFELDLLAHLAEAGVPTMPPVERRDGDVLSVIDAPEGSRYAALFRFAPGRPEPVDVDSARTLGGVCARIHDAASGFVTTHRRYHLDADLLLEMPVREVTAFLDGSRDQDLRDLRTLATQVRSQIEAIPKREPYYGVIHADLHGGNVFWADGMPTILDFDHCGYGWRAYDLVPAIEGLADEVRESFLDGYRVDREMTQEELDLLPAFRQARILWDDGDILAMADHLVVRRHFDERFWDGYFARVREMLA